MSGLLIWAALPPLNLWWLGWLAPIGYLEMFSAALVGWVAFGDIPDIWTVTGIVLIVAAGLYVSWRENQLARRAKAAMRDKQALLRRDPLLEERP